MIKNKVLVKTAWFILGLSMLAAVNFIPMASKKTPNMESYVFSGISCWAVPEDKGAASAVAEEISSRAKPVTESLGEALAKDITVIVYPDRKVLHRKTIGLVGMFLPDWYIGKNTRQLVMITSPDNPGPQHDRESIIKAGVHEYVHLLTDRRNKNMDLWLKEGFALYLADQKPDVGSIIANSNLSYKDFSTKNSLRFAEAGGYSLAYSMMEFLTETYGWTATLSFLEPGNSFKSVTGLEKKEFLNSWMTWIRSSYS